MNINSRPLSLNMLANVDKFAGRLGCLEVRLPWLPRFPRRNAFGRRICRREITLVAEVALKRCLRAADSREIILVAKVASKRCLRAADSREITLVAEVASKDAFGRRIRGRFPWLPRLPRKMPSGGGFEEDYFGRRVASK